MQTQQPKRELPQLGVEVSTTKGHSLSAVAPLYIENKSLLLYPQGFENCIKYSQTSSVRQSSIGV